tara:strand:- start:9361 stop:9585 length:225 start_codon:yes stop_codon:yes gene_type:complete
MGFNIIKWLCKRFKCDSECTFNVADLPKDLLHIDLSQYQLKPEDLKVIWNIQNKRPSVHNYKHAKAIKYQTHEI